MPRPPKNKAPEAAKPAAAVAVEAIDVANFIRVRDSIYTRLTTVQEFIRGLTMDYLRQTNMLLGEGIPLDNGAADMVNLESALTMLPAPVPGIIAPPIEEKKERKKRTHDPNAPKRPLTPYFLYMQTARPIIAQDLGADAPKGAVQAEGQRRWGTMSGTDKAGWDQAYQYNLRLYNARVHSYKSGNANAKLMSDDEALKYADEYNIPMPTGKEGDAGNEQDAIAEQLQANTTVVEEEAPAAKTPKSTKKEGGGRKRKTATPGGEVETAKSSAAAASPDKKRKRTSKVTEEKEPEPKKSGRKKAKSG